MDEAMRRIKMNETGISEWKATKEEQLTLREFDFAQVNKARLEQHRDFETHHKTLLELERGQHAQTMERTLNRITRQLQFGDADHSGGRRTPTRELLAAAVVPPI